jgi:hypothetical protein
MATSLPLDNQILDLFGTIDYDPDYDYKAQRQRRSASPLIILDPALLSGEWTWVPVDTGELRFQPTDANQDQSDDK